MTLPQVKAIKVFYSYSHKDEALRDKLEEHLSLLKRQGYLAQWHDRRIGLGKNIDETIDENLDNANIILLLVSSSFIASDYCYDKELKRALKRHQAGDARVIPIILRPCDWHEAPFGKLSAFPKDGEAVTKWANEDEAFLDIAKGIRCVISELSLIDLPEDGPTQQNANIITPSPQLPLPSVGFIQRHDSKGENFIQKIHHALVDSDHHTIVLWGSGGVGKTTLAAQFARISESKKKVIWLSADGRNEFNVGILLDEIAALLGQGEARLLAPLLKRDRVTSLLGEHPSLVILDNFETIDPAHQPACLDLLNDRRFETLITTRERIKGFKNENIFEMSNAEAETYLECLIEDSTFPAAFSEDIRQKTISTAESNPLAMQWIVGQIDTAQSPREVFEDLEHGEGDAAERVFNRSFRLPQLGSDGQNILLALSLFVQSARRKAIRDIVGVGKDLKKFNRALTSLANLRLINVTEGIERLFLGGLTKQFARAYLDRSLSATIYRKKFVTHFKNLCKKHSEMSFNNLNHLEEERVNILHALDLSYDLEEWDTHYLIVQGMVEFLDIRGYWEDLARIGKIGLELATKAKDQDRIAWFASVLGILFTNRGDILLAEKYYKGSLAHYRRLDSKYSIAVSLHNLGILAASKGELDRAFKLFKEALAIHRKLRAHSQILRLLGCLGNLALDKGETREAETFFATGLEIQNKTKDFQARAYILAALGRLALRKGSLEEATNLLDESLAIFEKLGDLPGKSEVLIYHARLAQLRSDADACEKLYYKSLEISRKLGSQLQTARVLNGIGELNFEKRNIRKAEKLLAESVDICEKIQYREGLYSNKRLLGRMHRSNGQFSSAEKLYLQSVDNFRLLGYRFQVALTLRELALLKEEKNDRDSACAYFKDALQLFEDIESPLAGEMKEGLIRLSAQVTKNEQISRSSV